MADDADWDRSSSPEDSRSKREEEDGWRTHNNPGWGWKGKWNKNDQWWVAYGPNGSRREKSLLQQLEAQALERGEEMTEEKKQMLRLAAMGQSRYNRLERRAREEQEKQECLRAKKEAEEKAAYWQWQFHQQQYQLWQQQMPQQQGWQYYQQPVAEMPKSTEARPAEVPTASTYHNQPSWTMWYPGAFGCQRIVFPCKFWLWFCLAGGVRQQGQQPDHSQAAQGLLVLCKGAELVFACFRLAAFRWEEGSRVFPQQPGQCKWHQ